MPGCLPTPPPEDPRDRIVADLAGPGWSVCPGFLSPEVVAALAAELDARRAAGGFRPAGIGTGMALQLRPDIRNDQVHWLGETPATEAQALYFTALESLRLAINQRLYLGLFRFEGHLALYPPGSFYRRHLDQLVGATQRKVSVILYLNHGWAPEDGGALRLYLEDGAVGEYRDILPHAGTLACFLSDRFHHEVLPTRRERRSLTGWFRVRD